MARILKLLNGTVKMENNIDHDRLTDLDLQYLQAWVYSC